jgi:CRP-like cAMP-binding protein
MFPTDVSSVHTLSAANLLVAAQAREHREVVHPTRAMHPWHRLTLLATSLRDRVHPRRDPQVATFGPLSASLELFEGLSAKQLAEFGRHVSVVRVPSGRSLGCQGESVRNFVIVIEGHVGVTIDGVPHAVFDAGTHFGAIALLDEPSSMHRATFTTMTPSRIAVANQREFREILHLFPAIARQIYLMADVRREFLADLAKTRPAEPSEQLTSDLNDYPAHLPV